MALTSKLPPLNPDSLPCDEVYVLFQYILELKIRHQNLVMGFLARF